MPNLSGEPYRTDPLGEWFICRVLTVIAGTPKTYTFEEWQLGGDGTWDTKTGGRVATADNPGYTLLASDDSEVVLAVDDFAWARAAFGAGGLFWEMIPAASTGSSGPTNLSWKNVVRCATTTSKTFATDFENGDAIDGVTLATGNRVLIKNQGTSDNGIYTVNASGAPTRATDADATDDMLGAIVMVSEGTTNADTIWMCTDNSPVIPNTTTTNWKQIYPTPRTTSSVGAVSCSTDSTWTTTGASVSLAPGTYCIDVSAIGGVSCLGTVGHTGGNVTGTLRVYDATNATAVKTWAFGFAMHSSAGTTTGDYFWYGNGGVRFTSTFGTTRTYRVEMMISFGAADNGTVAFDFVDLTAYQLN